MIELTQVNTKQLCIEREIKHNKMAMNGHVPRKGMRIWPKLHQNGNRFVNEKEKKKKHMVACRAGWENIRIRR